ncbi:MAG: hypothetical protein FJ299_00800 [Planctomycetes bacterium]|nr:hypothetical protein [Planctomycetota bacterium]
MEIYREGPIKPVRPERLEEQRAEVIQSIRARTEAAARQLREFRQTMGEGARVGRDEILLGRDESTQRAEQRGRDRNADRMEFSERARALAAATTRKDEVYERRVSELREEHDSGRLYSAERLERAARRLLGESEPS